jgi:class 3 adenylate cyclase
VAAETVTVLFTDMVGSTAQRQRLGDEAANAVLAEHDEIVRRAAESHGGRVVEGTGDGAMLAFDAAGEAVRAAVAIQQGVDQRNRRAVERIELRIGLSSATSPSVRTACMAWRPMKRRGCVRSRIPTRF